MSGRTRAQARASEQALVAVIRASPGLRGAELSALMRAPPSAILARVHRLEDRGEIEQTKAKRWYVAGAAPSVDALSLKDAQLLEALRNNPGASTSELAILVGGVSRGAIAGRVQRLGQRGLLVKRKDQGWVIAPELPEAPGEPVEWTANHEPEALSRWVRSISQYVRTMLDGAPARYG